MKNKFYWVIAFVLCINNANAQTLKTYSGKFQGGQATYTYRDNPNGGRIFEGKFTYISGSGNLQITGSYKNDKKDGLWTYKDGTDLLKIHYKEGVRNGSYIYQGENLNLSLFFKENKIIGKVTAKGNIGILMISNGTGVDAIGTLSGQFNENGYADGEWILDTTPYDRINIYRAIYSDGYLTKSSIEDVTTGDISSGVRLAQLPYLIVHDLKLFEKIDRGMDPFPYYDIDKKGTPPNESDTLQTEAKEVLQIAEQMPSFPGGMGECMKWLAENVNYPSDAKEKGVEGRVIVQFVVNKDGSISDIEIIRSITPELDKEAIRAVEAMPKWVPGKQDGQAVNVKFTLPITFKLQ